MTEHKQKRKLVLTTNGRFDLRYAVGVVNSYLLSHNATLCFDSLADQFVQVPILALAGT
jgi:hypothetical protein